MALKLSPNFAQKKIFDGGGGSYEAWSSAELADTKVGAGKLVLQPRGFAFPHYADSSKLGFVLQGTEGVVGVVLPNSSKERVLKLKKGDVIPVPLGYISWWYNNGNSELSIVFIGETSKSYVPGEFTYFILSGTLGNIRGFSPQFISRAYNVNEEDANKLATSQTGTLIIKLEPEISMPYPNHDFLENLVYNIIAAPADLEVQNGGIVKNLTEDKFPFIEKVGLSFSYVKLEGNAMYSPTYSANGEARVFYVVNGSGQVQIVGINGGQVLDAKLEAGQLFLVPRFFSVAQIAGLHGLELISITTSTWGVIEELATRKSVWNALSPIVTQVSLGVTPKLEEVLKNNVKNNSILIPPPNRCTHIIIKPAFVSVSSSSY